MSLRSRRGAPGSADLVLQRPAIPRNRARRFLPSGPFLFRRLSTMGTLVSIESQHAGAAQRAAFDGRYGDGSFDELLRRLGQPCISFAQIASHFGVTRERVRQWHRQWLPDAPTGSAASPAVRGVSGQAAADARSAVPRLPSPRAGIDRRGADSSLAFASRFPDPHGPHRPASSSRCAMPSPLRRATADGRTSSTSASPATNSSS